jgi:hypothetical protein
MRDVTVKSRRSRILEKLGKTLAARSLPDPRQTSSQPPTTSRDGTDHATSRSHPFGAIEIGNQSNSIHLTSISPRFSRWG